MKEKEEKDKKIKKEKMPKEKKAKKEKVKKDKETSKFVQKIKKKWLIDGTKTLVLVLLIVLVFLALNTWIQSLELTPIDLTEEKLYTLTDESKERVKDIDKDVNIYFVGYTDGDSNLELAKQYKNANERIVAESVNAEDRPDLAEKYGIESGSTGIIVECGDRSKVLTESDLVTYDTTTYETISIAEERLTVLPLLARIAGTALPPLASNVRVQTPSTVCIVQVEKSSNSVIVAPPEEQNRII